MDNDESLNILLIDISSSMGLLIDKVNDYINFRKRKDGNSNCLVVTFGITPIVLNSPTEFKNISLISNTLVGGTSLNEGLISVHEYLEYSKYTYKKVSLLIFTDGKLEKTDRINSHDRISILIQQFNIRPFIVKLDEMQLERVKTIFPYIPVLDEMKQKNYTKKLVYLLCFILLFITIKITFFSKDPPKPVAATEQKETKTIKRINSIKTTELYSKKPKNFLVYARGKTYEEIIELYKINNENDKKVIFNVLREYNRQLLEGNIWDIKLKDTIKSKFIKVPNLSSMLLDTLDENNQYSTLYSKQQSNELIFINIERIKK